MRGKLTTENYGVLPEERHITCLLPRTSKSIEEYKLLYPSGFMLSIYGTSTGSLSIEQEGKMQLTNRGYQTPPIVDVDGKTIAQGVQGAHGPGGESVFDCGSSRVLSKAVEKAAHLHFAPLCDASQGMMPRTWRVIGVGAPKGTGPYHVCIRVMPLPLPLGWRRSF
ncbi:ATP-dependent DNA helicase PIF1 [Pseudoscourfieldia marina]